MILLQFIASALLSGTLLCGALGTLPGHDKNSSQTEKGGCLAGLIDRREHIGEQNQYMETGYKNETSTY